MIESSKFEGLFPTNQIIRHIGTHLWCTPFNWEDRATSSVVSFTIQPSRQSKIGHLDAVLSGSRKRNQDISKCQISVNDFVIYQVDHSGHYIRCPNKRSAPKDRMFTNILRRSNCVISAVFCKNAERFPSDMYSRTM